MEIKTKYDFKESWWGWKFNRKRFVKWTIEGVVKC